tara:strand:- start:193 stop:831 length:639 start_codon:yes stop_codon:yes gene_type:complete
MTLKRLGSEIITDQKATHSSDQTLPTKNGALTPLSGEQQQRALARLLQIADPAQADKSLVTFLKSLPGLTISSVNQVRYPKDKDAQITLLRFDVTVTDEASLDRALQAVQASLTPLPKEDITKQLTMLATLVVKPSGETAKDQAIRIKSIAAQLIKYPADIVLYAVQKVGESCTFWPAYAEFHKHIEWRIQKRQKLLDALTSKKVARTANLQ